MKTLLRNGWRRRETERGEMVRVGALYKSDKSFIIQYNYWSLSLVDQLTDWCILSQGKRLRLSSGTSCVTETTKWTWSPNWGRQLSSLRPLLRLRWGGKRSVSYSSHTFFPIHRSVTVTFCIMCTHSSGQQSADNQNRSDLRLGHIPPLENNCVHVGLSCVYCCTLISCLILFFQLLL